MKYGRDNKASREKELKCLEGFIKKVPAFVNSEECIDTIAKLRDEFNSRIDKDVKKAFAPPHDQLIDYECGKKKIETDKMFERFSFFVVLATMRNMNDKQIEAIAKTAESSVNNAQTTIFECMKW